MFDLDEIYRRVQRANEQAAQTMQELEEKAEQAAPKEPEPAREEKTREDDGRRLEILGQEITPEQLGLRRCTLAEIETGTPQENADSIRGVFSGRITGPRRDAILINAAGALVVGGKARDLAEGVALARQLIESGLAQQKLRQLVECSHRVAQEGVA